MRGRLDAAFMWPEERADSPDQAGLRATPSRSQLCGTAPAAVFFSRVMANTRISPATMETAPTKPSAAGELCAMVTDAESEAREHERGVEREHHGRELHSRDADEPRLLRGEVGPSGKSPDDDARRTGTRAAAGASK